MITLPLLSATDKTSFPDVNYALEEPNGLLAFGGDLSVERLVSAYHNGIFPWFSQGEPILWWSPDPRTVLYLDDIHVSRSLKKFIRKNNLSITVDNAFNEVIQACAEPRLQQKETWILPEMIDAYSELHKAGYAHSIEVWQNDKLVGGLYGVALGQLFFGESMFSRIPNGSKIALFFLAKQLYRWGFRFIDCQVYSNHLESMGAISIPRDQFISEVNQYTFQKSLNQSWQCDNDLNEYIKQFL